MTLTRPHSYRHAFVLLISVALTAFVYGCGASNYSGTTTVPPVLQITAPPTLPGAESGAFYSETLTASGGTPPYTWSVSVGAPPANLTLSPAGVLSGTPAATGTFGFTAKVTDAAGGTYSAPLEITIVPLPEITSTSPLTGGQVNMLYSVTLAATDGIPPYVWTVSAGAPPGGLKLSTAGVLSGTPTAAGTFNFTAKITDAAQQTNSVPFLITIAPPPLMITTSMVPNAEVGAFYSTQLAATGGTIPYSWSVVGAPPANLTLSPAGVLSGTPNASGTFGFTAKVTDAAMGTYTAPLQITIVPPPQITSTSPLTGGEVNVLYSTTLTATGGTMPYIWTVSAGAPPGGLKLSNAGVFSGTPTTAGTFNFTAMITDAAQQTNSVPFQITIVPPPQITTASPLTGGEVNVAYSTTLAATGGTTPYVWSFSAGAPPGGLKLSSAGILSGTPTTAGTFNFTAKITDAAQQTNSVPFQITIAPLPQITSTSPLPSGQLNVPYSTTLAATGGTMPYIWSVSAGALPDGLKLSPAGVLSGTPTTAATFNFTAMITDAAQQTDSVSFQITILNVSVSLSPSQGGVSINQKLPLTATVTNDVGAAGVTWMVSAGGTLSSQTTTTSSFSSTTHGVYTITATSVADNTKSASATIGVTDLAGVFTYHNDLSRDGSNPSEYALTTSNVTANFGKLFSCTADGAIYTQPLWVANLTINGAKHNVVFVATQHDSLYAFDADTSPCVTLWQVSLIDTNHGGSASETTVPSGPSGFLVGTGSGDITPEVGVTGTPVIDPATNTLYVVSKSVIPGGPTFFQRLHAINILTGAEQPIFGSPVTIMGTYPGIGDGTATTTFNAQQQNQRPALALVNGVVYIAWASHEDNDSPAYYGWVFGYNKSNLAQPPVVLNITPNVQFGGIWMAGSAPAADASNNLYLITGNGGFDANSGTAPNNDYGDSFLEISTTGGLSVSQYFTPSDQLSDDTNDNDFGAGGAAILVDQPSSPVPHLVIGGGKDGTLYLLNRDLMGGLGDSNSVQNFNIGSQIFATGAYWNGQYYIAGVGGPLQTYSFNTITGMFNQASVPQSPGSFGFPGSTPSVSSSGTTNGIVWALDNGNFCTPGPNNGCGPTILHAFDATNTANNMMIELWNSTQGTGNSAGNAVKFAVPTVANGKVYVGTRGNDDGVSGTVSGELDVYGLLP